MIINDPDRMMKAYGAMFTHSISLNSSGTPRSTEVILNGYTGYVGLLRIDIVVELYDTSITMNQMDVQ
jgi:hypothetical protein